MRSGKNGRQKLPHCGPPCGDHGAMACRSPRAQYYIHTVPYIDLIHSIQYSTSSSLHHRSISCAGTDALRSRTADRWTAGKSAASSLARTGARRMMAATGGVNAGDCGRGCGCGCGCGCGFRLLRLPGITEIGLRLLSSCTRSAPPSGECRGSSNTTPIWPLYCRSTARPCTSTRSPTASVGGCANVTPAGSACTARIGFEPLTG
jgi:hypothetical protein